jgi:hypothetical protein
MNSEDKAKLIYISNLDEANPDYEKIMVLHKRAIENDEDTYADPSTGYKVFTAAFLLKRVYCCGSGCRHCPYK